MSVSKASADLIRSAVASKKAQIALARVDFDAFCEYVLRDEETGTPIRMGPHHIAWTKLRKKHKRLQIIAGVELGKSQQISVALPLFELGRNPELRVAIVCRTHRQATGLTALVAKYIESSERLHDIFPDLREGPSWKEGAYTVQRQGNVKDPSLSAYGSGGDPTGARIDLAILDDYLDTKNTATKGLRDMSYRWYFVEIHSRLTRKSRVIVVGNAWTTDDLYTRLEKAGWKTVKCPVIVTKDSLRSMPILGESKADGGFGLKVGQSVWEAQWSLERIEERRAEVYPIEFARSMMCETRDDSDARFKAEWIEAALDRGADLPVCLSIGEFLHWDDPSHMPDAPMEAMSLNTNTNTGDFWVFSGVDLSTGKSEDKTSIITIAVDRVTKKRFLLNVVAGKWQVDKILENVLREYARYGGIFHVENNASQDFIIQILHGHTAIPVLAYTTGKAKADPILGIEAIASELHAGKWIFPSKDGLGANKEIDLLTEEILFYDPTAHTGDRLMSMWMAQILAARMERIDEHAKNRQGIVVI